MKLFTAALILVVAVWYVAKKTTLLDKVVNKDVTSVDEVMPKAERAAAREKARVNQVHSVESAAAGQTVTETMTQDEVRSIWGEPNSIERDAARNEIWRYESIGKKVTFRDAKVWSVEGL
jgi:hypothetical protein